MDLRQLKTFRAVVELGTLTKAADRLHVAQPALSRHIRLLEHDLKAKLFVRHGRGMVPTEAGYMLFERTAGLIRQLELAREDVRGAAGVPSGRVVLGMVPTVSAALALVVAQKVVSAYPQVSLRLVDAYASFLIEGLHRSEIDLAVVYGPASGLHLEVETLRHDELYLIGAPGALNGDRSVSLDWAARQPLVLPSAPHALRLLIDDAFRVAGLSPSVRVEADAFQALIELVAGGVGVTFLPLYAAASHIRQGLVEAASIAPSIRRELVLALPSSHRMSLATRTVADIVRSEALKFDHDVATAPEQSPRLDELNHSARNGRSSQA